MTAKVGIPRGLFFYKLYPLWKTFFEELGTEVVVSDQTSKRILDDGVKSCVDEACLPVKLFFGHVINLKGKVDYLFIPRLTSISRNEYICPKFGGLPDMIRNSFDNIPLVIDTEINLRKKKENEIKAVLETGRYFSSDDAAIIKAYEKALESYGNYKKQIESGIFPGDIIDKKLAVLKKPQENALNIAVIGHAYNLYDRYANMDLLRKLKNMGVNPVTVEMLDSGEIDSYAKTLNKQMFWYFGRKAVGSALSISNNENMNGIIYIMAFGCGVDSFVCDMAERNVRNRRDIPYIVLTIDEHSGEAGLDTRLEAFIDMIRWRKKNEADVSAYG